MLDRLEDSPELQKAVMTALEERTLTKALASIVTWEHLRILEDVRRGHPATNHFEELVGMIVQMYMWHSSDQSDHRLDNGAIRLRKED